MCTRNEKRQKPTIQLSHLVLLASTFDSIKMPLMSVMSVSARSVEAHFY